MQVKYIIIESKKEVIEKLQKSFSKHENYYCIGVASDYEKSLELILEYIPDVVFMDVDDCGSAGFNALYFMNDLYKYMQELPQFIALSSTKDYAYDCLKNNFFDYLLKPVSDLELRKTLSRFNKRPIEKTSKLCLKSYKDYRFIDIDEILFLKADNASTDFFMVDGTKVSAYKTLKFFEDLLPDNFTRIHNSYIVNQNYVSRIHFGRSKCTLKNNNFNIPFSKSYRENVIVLEKELSKKAILSLN